jgi:hypothetical protein
MADDPLGNLKLPYDYSKGDPDAAPAAAPTVQTQTPIVSHPDLDKIPVPYGQSDQPASTTITATQPTIQSNVISRMGNWLIGANDPRDPATGLHNLPADTLQPRSLSQVGTDVENYGRVAGNQAFVPGAPDVGLAAWKGDTVADENKKTAQAESQLDPVMAALAKFQGQRLSANRMAGEAGVPYANSPLAQGVVTGGGGTLLHGGNWTDAIANTAADTGLSALGESVGTGASALAKKAFDRSSQAVSGAATAGLEDLQSLWKRGGDVAAAADKYADSATGAAKQAYQNIADTARQSTETGPAQRLAAGTIGHFLPGGELASAYIADPAIQAYNRLSKGLDVTHAIHSAYEPVASTVKSAIDPDAWRNAIQSFAVAQGPKGTGTLDAVRNFSPTSWAKVIWPGSGSN